MSANLLTREISPYLLQHKDNPVHWRPWGPEAFAEAGARGVPVLLSVGYAACHWCHVMAHESFEDPAIAALMNDLFVNVKVDREERPDVDSLYQSALSFMGEQGGWPLTMFLTPEGRPFWGGTYFPAAPRYGRPAFPDLLRRVAEVYAREGETVAHNAAILCEALDRPSRPRATGALDGAALDGALRAALKILDPQRGGTLGAPKFPQAPLFRFLWRVWRRQGSRSAREAVLLTLTHLCQGGLYDHLGGGFARYATDAAWLVPHFEKMLYDNAQLIELLAEAWLETRDPLFETRLRETVAWLLSDMRTGGAAPGSDFAFASAFDADSEGVEGQYYVWGADEIDRVLGPDAPDFRAAYGVSEAGNWEGVNILHRDPAAAFDPASAAEARLAAARARLLAVRGARVPPLRDDKVLADWNGLAVAALTFAGTALDEPTWVEAAKRAFAFVTRELDAGDGRLFHAWRDGQARHPAVLDDYANMARAALALFEATGEPGYLARARVLVAVLDRHYWDPGGGYFLTADDTTDILARPRPVMDTATPAGNGVMVEVLGRLYHLTGERAFEDRARVLATVLAPADPGQLLAQPTLAANAEILDRPVQIVIAGAPDDPAARALWRVALESAPPGRVLTRRAGGGDLPAGHPAQGKGPVDGRPAAYVCVGPSCGLPLTAPGALRDALGGL